MVIMILMRGRLKAVCSRLEEEEEGERRMCSSSSSNKDNSSSVRYVEIFFMV
jgi:hypothetical protein